MPTFTELYRPTTKDEFVGNTEALEKLIEVFEAKDSALLYGSPGIGKTTAVRLASLLTDTRLVEYNASEERKKDTLSKIVAMGVTNSFQNFGIFLDEVDGIKDWSYIEHLIKTSKHTVIMSANDVSQIPDKIQQLCTKIRFYDPKLPDVVQRIKQIQSKTGIKPNYTNVTTDIRSSINSAFLGGEKYHTKNVFEHTEEIFRGETDDIQSGDLIWILDNLPRNFNSKDLYENVKIVALAARTNHPEIVCMINHSRARIVYPHFLRRIKIQKGAKAT